MRKHIPIVAVTMFLLFVSTSLFEEEKEVIQIIANDMAQFFATHLKTTGGNKSTNRSSIVQPSSEQILLTGWLDDTGPIAMSENIGVTAKNQTLRKNHVSPQRS